MNERHVARSDDARFASALEPVVPMRPMRPMRPIPPENERVREDRYPGTEMPWWGWALAILGGIAFALTSPIARWIGE